MSRRRGHSGGPLAPAGAHPTWHSPGRPCVRCQDGGPEVGGRGGGRPGQPRGRPAVGRLAGHRPLHRLEPGVSFGPHEAWGRTWGEYQTRVRAAFSPMCPQGPGALETPASEHRGRRLRGRGLSPGQLQPAGNREAEPRLTGSPGAWRTLRDGAGATEGVAAGSVESTWGRQEPGLADVDVAGAEWRLARCAPRRGRRGGGGEAWRTCGAGKGQGRRSWAALLGKLRGSSGGRGAGRGGRGRT